LLYRARIRAGVVVVGIAIVAGLAGVDDAIAAGSFNPAGAAAAVPTVGIAVVTGFTGVDDAIAAGGFNPAGAAAAVSIVGVTIVALLRGLNDAVSAGFKPAGGAAAVIVCRIIVVAGLADLDNPVAAITANLTGAATTVSIVSITIIAGLARILDAVATDRDVLSVEGQAIVGLCLEVVFAVGLIGSGRTDEAEGRRGALIGLDADKLNRQGRLQVTGNLRLETGGAVVDDAVAARADTAFLEFHLAIEITIVAGEAVAVVAFLSSINI
jgi:hypothetical protein